LIISGQRRNDYLVRPLLLEATLVATAAIKLIHAKCRGCIYVPITQDGKVVDCQGYLIDAEDE
jgi:hypothetical protein